MHFPEGFEDSPYKEVVPYNRPKRMMGRPIPLVNYDVPYRVKTGRFINI